MLNASPHVRAYDNGLLTQSLAAAALVEVSRYDSAALAALHGRSFLVDAFAEVDSFLVDENKGSETETGDEPKVLSLVERILLIFQGHLAKARSEYEQKSLFDIFTFLMTTVGLVVSLHQSLDSSVEQALEKQTSSNIAQTERLAKILEAIDQKLTMPNKEMAGKKADHYIVRRTVPLKELRSMKSRTLATLYPNQVVLLVERDQNWIEVEYFDHLAGETRTGWLIKKYLKLMER
ncbi:hypothetical protein GCM10007856_40660 [Azospirillum oryzae]|nr:hypothetical protein GCM10007856_40660 [Azospirillum oryzae]